MGHTEGQLDPFVGKLAELGVGRNLRSHLRQERSPNELGRALASVDPTQLVIGAMFDWVFS